MNSLVKIFLCSLFLGDFLFFFLPISVHAENTTIFQDSFEDTRDPSVFPSSSLKNYVITGATQINFVYPLPTKGYRSNNSLKLVLQDVNAGALKVARTFDPGVQGTLIRVYFYDDLALQKGTIFIVKQDPNEAPGTPETGIGVKTDVSADKYIVRLNGAMYTSKISRSQGWHLFEIISTSWATYIKIDNQLIRDYVNTDQTSARLVAFVNTWFNGESYYDELSILGLDSSPLSQQYVDLLSDFNQYYVNTDFSGLSSTLGTYTHANDLRSIFDGAFALYVYGKKSGDTNVKSKAVNLFLFGLNNGHWDSIRSGNTPGIDTMRGAALTPFVYSAYVMWNEFDQNSKNLILQHIAEQIPIYFDPNRNSGPYQFYNSPNNFLIGSTYDTKAEEHATQASFLAAVVNFFPVLSKSPYNIDLTQVENKAKCFAYHTITTTEYQAYPYPNNPECPTSLTTQTVHFGDGKNYQLDNHTAPSAVYSLAVLNHLGRGSLSYKLKGKPIPDEFKHNVVPLYNKTLAYLTNSYHFNTSDDWSGTTNSAYYGSFVFPFMAQYGNEFNPAGGNNYYNSSLETVRTDFDLQRYINIRSIFYKDILGEWVPIPPALINVFDQSTPASFAYDPSLESTTNYIKANSYRYFMDGNIAGNTIAAALVMQNPTLFNTNTSPAVTSVTINSQPADLSGGSAVNVSLPGTVGQTGTYDIPIVITYADGYSTRSVFRFNYRPNIPSPTPTYIPTPTLRINTPTPTPRNSPTPNLTPKVTPPSNGSCIPGDVNGDGCIGSDDFNFWLSLFSEGGYDITADIYPICRLDGRLGSSRDEKLDLLDFNAWFMEYSKVGNPNRCL